MADKSKGIWRYLALLSAVGSILFFSDNVAVAFRPAATFGWRQVAIHDTPSRRISDLAGINVSTIRKHSPYYLTNNSEMDSLPRKNARDTTDPQKHGKDNTKGVRPSVGSRKPLSIPHPVSTRTASEISSSNASHNQASKARTMDETANRFMSTKTTSCQNKKDGEEVKEAINSKKSVSSSYKGMRPSIIEVDVVRANGNLKARNAPLNDANILDGKYSQGLFNAAKRKVTQATPPRETSNEPVSAHDTAEVSSVKLPAVSPSNFSSVAGHVAKEVDEATNSVDEPTENALKTSLPVSFPADVDKRGENTSASKSEEKQGNGRLAPKYGKDVNKRNESTEVTSLSNTTDIMENDGASAFVASKSKAANKVVKGENRDMLKPFSPTMPSTDRLKVDALTSQTINSLPSKTNTVDKKKSGESTSGSDVNGSSGSINPLVDEKLPRHSTTPSGKIDGINHSKKEDAATILDLLPAIAPHKSRAAGTTSSANCSSSDSYPEFNSASILTNASKSFSTVTSHRIRSGDNTSAPVSPQKPDTISKGTRIPRSTSKLDDGYEKTKDVNRLMQSNEFRTKDGIDPVNKTSGEDALFVSSTPIDAANLHTTKNELDLPLTVTPESSSNPEKADKDKRRMSGSGRTASNPKIKQNNTVPLVAEALLGEKSTLRSSSDDVSDTFDRVSSRGEWGATTEVNLRSATPMSTNTSLVKSAANFQDDSDLFASLSDKQNKRNSVGTGANVTDIDSSGTSGKETQAYDDNKSSQSSRDNFTKSRSDQKVKVTASGSETRRVQNDAGFVEGQVGKQHGGVPNPKVFKVMRTGNGVRHSDPSSTRVQGRDSVVETPERQRHHAGNYAIAVASPEDPWTNAMNMAAQARETIAQSFSTYVEQQLEGFHSSHGKKIDLAAYGGQQMATAALDGGRSALFGMKAILDTVTSDEVGSAANETFRKSMTFVRRVVDLASTKGNIHHSSGDEANIAPPQKVGSDGSGSLQDHHPDTTKRKLSKTVRSARSAIAAFGSTSVAFVRKMQSDVATGRAVEAAREMAEKSASALSAIALLGAKHVASMEEAWRWDADDGKPGGEPTPRQGSRGRGGNGEEKFRRNSLNLLAKLRGARNDSTSKRSMNGGSTEREMKGGSGNMYFATPVNKVDG